MEHVYQKSESISLDIHRTKPTYSRNTINPDGWDRDFYLKAYPDVNTKFIDPFKHYNTVGKKERRLPNMAKFHELYPLFDIDVYVNSNPDLTRLSTEELMGHFHRYGRLEHRIFKRDDIKSDLTIISTSPASPMSSSTKCLDFGRKNISRHSDFVWAEPPKDPYIDKKNYPKIKQSRNPIDDDEINLGPILMDLLHRKDQTRPVYLILSEWGNPPFGGGECWLIDTAKWMYQYGFSSYYISFNDPFNNRDFDQYEIEITPTCTFIRFPRDLLQLIRFITALNPSLISHQGPRRLEHLRTAKLLEKPFITGFCFWQDLIQFDGGGPGEIFNQNMLQKTQIPDPNFKWIYEQVSSCYVASQFMAEIIKRIHNVDIPVINTITDESQYKITKKIHEKENDSCENIYVTVVNICGLKGGRILKAIIDDVPLDIPFLLIDSQEMDNPLNRQLHQLLIQRNVVEKSHKSIYIRGPINDMKRIYQQTRILLIPTLVDETFCRVGYEGMMNEIPTISTGCGNLQFLLKGYADILDPQPQLWSHRITQIYHDHQILEEMSHRPKTINPKIDRQRFIDASNWCIINQPSSYFLQNNVGLLCPWADQGLGIQCREYYNILRYIGYTVSVFSFKPYRADQSNPRLQVDPTEWDYPNIYYGNHVREEITSDEFIDYLYTYRVKKMIIVETCYSKVFELAKICRLFGIQVIAIPNLETIRCGEVRKHDLFDKIICNNQMTYQILSRFFPQKTTLVGFRILNTNFTTQKQWLPHYSFFCSGGLNAISRKNIDKIMKAFKELENEGKLGSFHLYVYVQGHEFPPQIAKYRSDRMSFSIGQKNYQEIVRLYQQHDIFIHMGDHEGLGLGFYESIVCGTPVMTIDTPPNNEIIKEGVNGWLVKCGYTSLDDNKEGITYRATITVPDLKAKMLEIINTYQREEMYQSTIMDYIKRYPIEVYSEQIKKMFS